MVCDPKCTCAPVYAGSIRTGALNWREDCEVHGMESEWYKDPEQRAARERANERLIELQRQAREARENVRNRPDDPR